MATTKKRGLGRGLNALIGGDPEDNLQTAESNKGGKPKTASKAPKRTEKPAAPQTKKEAEGGEGGNDRPVNMVNIHLITPDKSQPREQFDADSLEELTASVKEFGILQPLIVQKKDDYYQLIAGERRFRAAMKAGLKEVPVIIKELDKEAALEVSLIENIQRDDLNPMEEAKAYKRLMDEFNLTQEGVAGKVGKSRSAVANALRLLNLDVLVQSMIASKELSEGHAKVLLGVADPKQQEILAKATVEKGWSVRQLEKAVQLLKKEKPAKEEEINQAIELILKETGRELQDILGTKVSILQGKKKGTIEIEYYSEDELDRILSLMRRLK